ncbi:hypothetical protein PSH13_16735, partial [Enterococcus casseliflavus]|nr:hypothetical protein [Enterococcus casseliflavus]
IIGNPSLNHRYRKGFYSLFKTLQQNRLMNEAIISVPQANVLAHFEYGFRIWDISVVEYQRLAEPMLVQVFRNAIAHDLTLEVNAKSIVLRHNLGYMNMRLSYGSHLVALNSL